MVQVRGCSAGLSDLRSFNLRRVHSQCKGHQRTAGGRSGVRSHTYPRLSTACRQPGAVPASQTSAASTCAEFIVSAKGTNALPVVVWALALTPARTHRSCRGTGRICPWLTSVGDTEADINSHTHEPRADVTAQ